jgi:hypothetical protein
MEDIVKINKVITRLERRKNTLKKPYKRFKIVLMSVKTVQR